jgi:hypothetical protein
MGDHEKGSVVLRAEKYKDKSKSGGGVKGVAFPHLPKTGGCGAPVVRQNAPLKPEVRLDWATRRFLLASLYLTLYLRLLVARPFG